MSDLSLDRYVSQGVTLLGDVSKLGQVTEWVNRKVSYDSMFGK